MLYAPTPQPRVKVRSALADEKQVARTVEQPKEKGCEAAGPSYLPCHHPKFSTTYAGL